MRLLLNRFSVHRFFNKKNWTNPASTFLTSHGTNLTINDKSVDGVLGSRTLGGRMEGADESTEVWRHRKGTSFFLHKKLLYFFTPYFLGEVGINIALGLFTSCCSRNTRMQETCGQSCKTSSIIISDSRVVPDWKIPHITTLESFFTSVKCL